MIKTISDVMYAIYSYIRKYMYVRGLPMGFGEVQYQGIQHLGVSF